MSCYVMLLVTISILSYIINLNYIAEQLDSYFCELQYFNTKSRDDVVYVLPLNPLLSDQIFFDKFY